MNKYDTDLDIVLSEINKKPNVFYVKWVIPPFRAMTIPPFGIFIKECYKGDNQILIHDMIHWKQYERMGLFLYYFRYLFQIILIGYETMPMEMEARRFDSEEDKWNYTKKYHKKVK
jgi:hypothetical protein